ncbi:DEAD-box ATP-dependent RNA helicase 46 isoform X2 [Hevea brasiliensis]|uniref:DEAD-box ATP-dependent RNA helicase 46 isoform X2 n=1 Tax=Hevea brasiliensis TaxID=3981 RepID=UPI0025E749A0|nr:DEAD-box ATP-dependent RNA helicase 46 isoform X2 [Hevea brasiliensis]
MAATATASSAGPRYAPEDPTLPKPWRGLVDGKTGYLYFWNPETNVTQYERPTVSAHPSKSSSVPISSSVQVQQSSRYGYGPVKEDDRYGRGNNAGSKFDAGAKSGQVARGGAVQSQNVPGGTRNGPSGSSARGHGSSAGGSILSAEAYRRRHEITVTGDEVPPPLTSFEDTGFPSEILREVHNAGFSAPTPIQAQSWPIALQSRDIVAIAKTGSGKTLGYLIPGFMHLRRCRNDAQLGPTVLVLSPTRELATQIQDEAVKFGKSSRISCTCLYGGAPKGPQLKELDRGADIVVATPGRLNDILEMRRISLSQVSYLVLDEADRMLDMGFEPQIRKIVKEVPARRQTLMYTATWPKEVRKIAADLLVNPVQVNIGNVDELVANKSITQYIEVLAPMEKHRRLEQILRSQEPGSKIIIFCSTKKMCDQLARNLTRQFGAAAIHGDKSQGERDYVLNQFRTGRSPVLVATDVAARGLDIKDIRVVINYDFPTGVEDYVHRIGRTGRAGATGVAYTFFGDQDSKYASDLIKVLEGANQRVPSEIRDMASRGGGMGRPRRWGSGPSGRDGGRGGRSDFGYGGREGGRGSWGLSSSSSSRPEKGGGRGYDYESRDRYERGYSDSYDRGRSRSRSPDRGSSWVDRSKSWNRDRSQSRSPDRVPLTRERSPVRSFHQAMMERARATSPVQNQRERSRSPYGGGNNSHKVSTREWSPGRSFHQAMMERGRAMTEKGRSSSFGAQQDQGRSPGSRHEGRGYNNVSQSRFGEEEEEGMIPADEDGMIPPDDEGMYRGADGNSHRS